MSGQCGVVVHFMAVVCGEYSACACACICTCLCIPPYNLKPQMTAAPPLVLK